MPDKWKFKLGDAVVMESGAERFNGWTGEVVQRYDGTRVEGQRHYRVSSFGAKGISLVFEESLLRKLKPTARKRKEK
jgi:hypothetical protein